MTSCFLVLVGSAYLRRMVQSQMVVLYLVLEPTFWEGEQGMKKEVGDAFSKNVYIHINATACSLFFPPMYMKPIYISL